MKVLNKIGLMACVLVLGTACKTSTVESRRTERWGAYSALPKSQQALIDQGDIEAGMGEDAVYIAWGAPAQILESGDKTGKTITWLYESTTHDTHYRWRTYQVRRDDGTLYLDRRMVPVTQFRDYVSARLIFKNGELQRWEMKPRPGRRSTIGGGGAGFISF
ncbi:MAG: hypothetical protein CMO80_02850 [Verrucomicrobiales bacterium]|nr:hypothetical protein [Verrucomicrobiales bacterium]